VGPELAASSDYPSMPAASQSTNKGGWDAAVTEIEPVQVATETGETRLLFDGVAAPRRAGSR
jgi:hypothetical protein